MRKLKVVPAFMALALTFGACSDEGGEAAPAAAAPVTPADQETSPAIEEEARSVQLALQDDVFAPEMLRVPRGDEVTVEVKNEGDKPHTFTIRSLDVDTGTLQPGDSRQVTFTAPQEDAEFICEIHPGMTGTLVPSN